MARQLLAFSPTSQIVALDFSRQSLDVARQRIADLNDTVIDNKQVTFVHSELPLSDGVIAIIGKFDYIETSGVLHHLPDPVSGLTSLSKVLKPNGCIGIMVYGLYGRRATYMLQDILKSTAKALDVSIRDEQMRDIARDILSGDTLYKNHPVNNDFKLSKTSDITQMGDAGLVDLLLHPIDRAYSVPQLRDDLLDPSGFLLHSFAEQDAYEPLNFLEDSRILEEAVGNMNVFERATLAELLAVEVSKHTFFAVKKQREVAAPVASNDEAAIPVVRALCRYEQLAEKLSGPSSVQLDFEPMNAKIAPKSWTFPALTKDIILLFDGSRNIGAIIDEVAAAKLVQREEVKFQVTQVVHALRRMNLLALSFTALDVELEKAMVDKYVDAGLAESLKTCPMEFWRF
jgi:SAM-dependent methyltransferase